MLVTARELDCQHIWNAHAGSARKAGVRGELVDALRERKELPALAADEAAVVNYGREFFRTRRVSRGRFRPRSSSSAAREWSSSALVMGNYSSAGAAHQLVRHRLAAGSDRAASARVSNEHGGLRRPPRTQ